MQQKYLQVKNKFVFINKLQNIVWNPVKANYAVETV